MKVSQVMTKGVECARPGDSIARASQRMAELNVGVLPVCGDNDRLVGMITDRDITVRGTATGSDPSRTTVSEIMSPDILYVKQDDDVKNAARVMQTHQVRRLVVLNDEKRLVGIVSLGDLAVDGGNDKLTGSTLEAVSEPARPVR